MRFMKIKQIKSDIYIYDLEGTQLNRRSLDQFIEHLINLLDLNRNLEYVDMFLEVGSRTYKELEKEIPPEEQGYDAFSLKTKIGNLKVCEERDPFIEFRFGSNILGVQVYFINAGSRL